MEKDKEMIYLVYKITNKINQNIYIGMHKTYDINDGYMGSGSLLLEDIKNIGIHNFEKEILFIFDNKEEMILKEAELVNKQFVEREDTYNLMLGGGFFCGELTKDTIVVKDKNNNKFRIKNDDERYLSGELLPITKGYLTVKDSNNETHFVEVNDERYLSGELVPYWKGIKKSEKSKYKISGENNPFYGKTHSTDTKLKISNANKLKIGELNPFYGKTHSEETKEKLSIIGKYLHETGKNKGFLGKKHSEETKKKMSLIDRSKEKNSQFGTCWINNIELRVNKKIKKEELDNWINDGWIKGMNKQFFKKVS
jgi:hypothetical protein